MIDSARVAHKMAMKVAYDLAPIVYGFLLFYSVGSFFGILVMCAPGFSAEEREAVLPFLYPGLIMVLLAIGLSFLALVGKSILGIAKKLFRYLRKVYRKASADVITEKLDEPDE